MLTWRDTLTCPTLSLYQKFNLLVCFYGNRRVFQYCSAFLFYSILTPLFAFVPEAVIPHWFPIFMHVTTVAYAIPHHK